MAERKAEHALQGHLAAQSPDQAAVARLETVIAGLREMKKELIPVTTVGMVYEFLPFMIFPLHTVMSKIDSSLIEAAQDLGCNGLYVFRKVIFPLSVPGIISGVTMVFVPTASTFLVAQYLGGTQFMIGDVIERVFQSDHHTGSAIAVVLMVVILGFLVFMNRFGDKEAVN